MTKGQQIELRIAHTQLVLNAEAMLRWAQHFEMVARDAHVHEADEGLVNSAHLLRTKLTNARNLARHTRELWQGRLEIRPIPQFPPKSDTPPQKRRGKR